jgi:DNA-binding response OmpR family regulator
LQQDGYNSFIAPTLQKASQLLASETIETIILDIQLPDGDGLDWLKEIRAQPGAKIIPVIVTTGREQDMNTYSIPFLIAWLRKPFQETDLLQALKVAVKPENVRQAKVLIVEDDRFTRNLIVDLMQHMDIEFIEAADGIAAVDLAKKEKPDLIILDIGLPYKDGFAVVEVLKEDKTQNTPLLVYTSRDIDKEDMQKLTLGLSRHLIKSKTSEAQFLDTVGEMLMSITKTAQKEQVK